MEKKILNQISSSLITFFSALKLYPEGHPAVKGPLDIFMSLIRPIIFEKNHLLIRFHEGLIVIEGNPCYELASQSEEICSFFEGRKLEGIEFHRGVGEKDVIAFFKLILSSDNPSADFNLLLEKKNIKTISVISFQKVEELDERAKKIYREAKKYVVEVMELTSQGKNPGKGDKAVEIMEEIGEIFDKDYNAIMPLVILQDYDEYTFNHTVNVGILSLALAKSLEFSPKEALATGVGGLLHDVGKARVPKRIILKSSQLTMEEWEILKKHPIYGAEIVQEMGGIDPYTVKVIYQHHVGYSLKGYPTLKNPSELTRGAIIVTTCDNYDAMTTQRPYQKRFEPQEALEIMRKKVGNMLEPVIFSRFVKLLGKYPLGSIVRLTTGEVGIVSRINPKEPDLPFVKVVIDVWGNKVEKPFEVDTSRRDPQTGRPLKEITGVADELTKALINLTHYFNI